MTEIFSALIGKKKQKTEIPIKETNFVSYLEKDLSDDLHDYVVVNSGSEFHYSGKIQPRQNAHKFKTTNNMGTTSSTYSTDTVTETKIPPQITTTLTSIYPSMPTPVAKQNSEELFGVSSFLTGVPFQLSSNLLALQSLSKLKFEGYSYLSNKAQLLEKLTYDFQTERDVLEETKCIST